MSRSPELNRFALWALVSTCVLLFPLGLLFGVVGLVQIARSRGQQSGALFAAIAILISGLVAPGAVWSAMYGKPKAFDQCYYTQENAVGILRLIAHLEGQFHEDQGRYGALEEIGFRPRVSTKPYQYAVDVHERDRFLATARGSDEMAGDLLTVDESRQVQRIQNRCAADP